MDPALVAALDADHETWPTDDPRLLAIRERAGARRRAVLVVDAALEVWWAERRAADPERAGAALAAHVSRAVAEARPGERYLVLDGGRLVQRGTHDELAGQPGVYAGFLADVVAADGWRVRAQYS
nr:hypothetical protein [Clavibacter michiganensis]